MAHIIGSRGSDIEQKIKSFNLRNAVCLLANAWNKITPSTIAKCWNVVLRPNHEWTEEDVLPLSIIRAEVINEQLTVSTIRDYLQEITPEITNEEIHSWISESGQNIQIEEEITLEQSETEDEDENVVLGPIPSKIRCRNAIESFNVCLQWAEENSCSLEDIMVLQKIREIAVQKNMTSTKTQSKISDFFP